MSLLYQLLVMLDFTGWTVSLVYGPDYKQIAYPWVMWVNLVHSGIVMVEPTCMTVLIKSVISGLFRFKIYKFNLWP
jgi:hypothetical protein